MNKIDKSLARLTKKEKKEKIQMTKQVSRGYAGEYQADERAVSRGSVAEYQADERAGVAWLSWRGSG